VEVDEPGVAASRTVPGPDAPQHEAAASADAVVAALYQANVLALSRLAYLMLGDQASAEDVVQEAFCGSVLRHRSSRRAGPLDQAPSLSAEAAVLGSEEREEVIRAVIGLPHRQREVLVLRYYCDLPDEQIASVMRIRQSTVRSTAHRALGALGRVLKETP
jgi:DNA-directed RNA polymerase specialized sigma24 family protein